MCQDGNRELIGEIDDETRVNLLKMMQDQNVLLDNCLGWKVAFLESEVERTQDVNAFVTLVMSWDNPKPFDINKPRLADLGGSEVQTAQLLLRMVAHGRFLKLMKEGADCQKALVDLAEALLHSIKTSKHERSLVLGSAVQELQTLCEFYLLVADPMKNSSSIHVDVLQTVQTAVHGALGLTKTALSQTPYWRKLVAQASSVCVAKETVMPEVQAALTTLASPNITLAELEGVVKHIPAWFDALGSSNLGDLIAKVRGVFKAFLLAGEEELKRSNYTPLEELIASLGRARQLIDDEGSDLQAFEKQASTALSRQKAGDLQATMDNVFAEYLHQERSWGNSRHHTNKCQARVQNLADSVSDFREHRLSRDSLLILVHKTKGLLLNSVVSCMRML